MKNFIILILLLLSSVFHAQDKKAYQLFDKKGKKVNFEKVVKDALKAEVVLFGEFHYNPICHWLQLELAKKVAAKKAVILGFEMIEADNQIALNSYLEGTINQKQLDSTARLWPNYKTDYKPLVDFAKANKLACVATNIPRRYASMVHKKGFEILETFSDEEKSWMAPLPMPYDKDLPGYTQMMTMMGDRTSPNMPKAQATKDATMAYFITKNLKPESVFIHYNGSFHSDNFDGINWYIKQYKSETRIVTIATVEQSQLSKLEKEHFNKADFILVVDEDMTKTY
jgi:uncharacterized iron-regulated protein